MLVLLCVLFLLMSIHPFTTYPLSLAILRRWKGRRVRRSEWRDSDQPSVALLTPAYNEESVIVAKAENLLALQRTVKNCEIFIYVDAATDRTLELLAPYRDRMTIINADVRRGKSYGLNLLVDRATADILVFSDANVLLEDNALRRIGARFSDTNVGCVCGHLRYKNGEESATAASGNLYWKIEEAIRELESDTVGIVGADGSLFATRRSLHPKVPADIIDDFYVSMKILLGGHEVVRADDAYAYERTGSDAREEFGRKVRIACQAFNVHRLLWNEIRSAPLGVFYAYISHRLMKWMIIYNLGVAAMLAVAAALEVLPASEVALACGVSGTTFGVAWRAGVKPAPQLGSMLMAFVGVGLGVVRSLRGDRFQTWNPMGTARVRGGR